MLEGAKNHVGGGQEEVQQGKGDPEWAVFIGKFY